MPCSNMQNVWLHTIIILNARFKHQILQWNHYNMEQETKSRILASLQTKSLVTKRLSRRAKRRFCFSFSALIKERDAITITPHVAIKVAGKKPLPLLKLCRGAHIEAEAESERNLLPPPRLITMGYWFRWKRRIPQNIYSYAIPRSRKCSGFSHLSRQLLRLVLQKKMRRCSRLKQRVSVYTVAVI